MSLLAAGDWQRIAECFIWYLLLSGTNNLNSLKTECDYTGIQ
jgi:hypothetical protein